MTESILKDKKNKLFPSPATYTNIQSEFDGQPSAVNNTSKNDKFCEFIDEASYRGSQTPAHIYDRSFVSLIIFNQAGSSRCVIEVPKNSQVKICSIKQGGKELS